MSIQIKVSKKEWKALSTAEKARRLSVLESLGIEIPKWMSGKGEEKERTAAARAAFLPRLRNSSGIPPAREYNLRIITRCMLCKTEHHQDFCMKRSFIDKSVLEANVFSGFPLDFIPDVTKIRYSNTCRCCQERLLELSPDVLVRGLIKTAAVSELPVTEAFAQTMKTIGVFNPETDVLPF